MILLILRVDIDYHILPGEVGTLCPAGVAEHRKCVTGDSCRVSRALADFQRRHVVDQKPEHRTQALTGKCIFSSFIEM